MVMLIVIITIIIIWYFGRIWRASNLVAVVVIVVFGNVFRAAFGRMREFRALVIWATGKDLHRCESV